MSTNMTVSYIVLGVYLLVVLGTGILGAFFNFRNARVGKKSLLREHFMAGSGLGLVVWFFSMAASLFSGYSVNGIVNEAFRLGWYATRWIPAGVGVYIGFLALAPRCHALGKQRGYMTMSELVFDRYLPPSGPNWVAHALRLLTFAFLQLPVFTYLITQFRSVGLETQAFTSGGISSLTAILVAAGVLLVCDLMGGMRAVAYSDVVQGVVLFLGSIIFLIIQRTQLGGLPAAFAYWSNPANLGQPYVAHMQLLPSKVDVTSYADFVFKTTVAATMFPHLAQRLFCAANTSVMRRGLGFMNLTFFLVQLSSMITGWVAINALQTIIKPGVPNQTAFGTLLRLVASNGTAESLASALLLASGICAMMSTADSALLAFSTMWVRDVYKPYIHRSASDRVQLLFGKAMAVVGLAVGVGLTVVNIQKGKPDLSSLFSLQSVTPIHVAPAVWLGLHWRGLRGEAVFAGMVSGAAVTLGLVFSDKNVKLPIGDDMLACGLSSALVGFFVNLGVTVVLGLAFQFLPRVWDRASAVLTILTVNPRRLDIGPVYDALLTPYATAPIFLLLLFSVPFYWTHYLQPNTWVGDFSAWAFTSLLLSGLMAVVAACTYIFLWRDYEPLPVDDLPSTSSSGGSPPGEMELEPSKVDIMASKVGLDASKVAGLSEITNAAPTATH